MVKPAITSVAPSVVTNVLNVYDPLEMDTDSRMSRRLTGFEDIYNYRLTDRSLLRQTFQQPITSHCNRRLAGLVVTDVHDRFATENAIGGTGYGWFCFNAMRAGTMAVVQNGHEAISAGPSGLAFRAQAGTRISTSDDSRRFNFWLEAASLEAMLGQTLNQELRRPLEFALTVAWDSGLAASLRNQILYLASEITRPDGLASSVVALASFTDLVMQTALQGLPNNYSERLVSGRHSAVPAYVHRAEAFMHAHAASPIQCKDVALAAGCSIRTLESAFGRFRDMTPLRALHAIRLEAVRADLRSNQSDVSVAAIARRYGFTNAARFAAAYRGRFGEQPLRPRKQGADQV